MSRHCADTTHPLLLNNGEQLILQRQGECIDLFQVQDAFRNRSGEASLGKLSIGDGARTGKRRIHENVHV
jgi:hypothetical protein